MEEGIGETTVYMIAAVVMKKKERRNWNPVIAWWNNFGEHTVMFAGIDEIIEIKHTALSKEVFCSRGD